MSCYLQQLDQTPTEKKWPLLRQWMDEVPLPLYAELREKRPILVLPEVTLVTRYADCTQVLRQYDRFSVALYRPKQGEYWMCQDDTAAHWREKSIMRSIMDLEDLAGIRSFVADTASAIIKSANGSMDAVNGLGRAVPIALVQQRFGFDQSKPEDLVEWSYWNQYDTFHNQPFDSILEKHPDKIIANREAANVRMGAYLGELLQRRGADLKAGRKNTDPTTRLLRLMASGGLKFDAVRVAQNVGGLLIGTVETTAMATTYALSVLLDRSELLPDLRAAAKAATDEAGRARFDGYVFEALRFKPAFPYFFRTCEQDTELCGGTEFAATLPKGTTVLAVTHAAMFDAAGFPDPDRFDPTRPMTNAFHFGQGTHTCLGNHIGAQMIPEIVRQLLLLPGIHATGPIDYKGTTVPEDFPLAWDSEGMA